MPKSRRKPIQKPRVFNSRWDHSEVARWNAIEDDMTTLVKRMVRACINETNPDVVASSEVHFRNIVAVARRMEFDFDIGAELFLHSSRWTRLTREYLPRDAWERFRAQAVRIVTERKRASTANMFFHDPKRYHRKHSWGGCLMGMTFTGSTPGFDSKDPMTLTLYSRTSYVSYMGLMDMCLVYVAAWFIAHDLDMEPGDITFRWYCSNLQHHFFNGLGHCFTQPDIMEVLDMLARSDMTTKEMADAYSIGWARTAKELRHVLKSFDEYGAEMNLPENEKFGPRRRIKRRWLEHHGYIDASVPSLHVEELTFDKADQDQNHGGEIEHGEIDDDDE